MKTRKQQLHYFLIKFNFPQVCLYDPISTCMLMEKFLNDYLMDYQQLYCLATTSLFVMEIFKYSKINADTHLGAAGEDIVLLIALHLQTDHHQLASMHSLLCGLILLSLPDSLCLI